MFFFCFLQNARVEARRVWVGQRGVALLELAVLISVLAILAGGAINYGWIFYERGILVDVAKDAARYASTADLNQRGEAITRANHLLDRLGMDQSDFTITPSCEPLKDDPPGSGTTSVFGIKVLVKRNSTPCFLMCLGQQTPPEAASIFRLQGATPNVCA